MSVVNLRKVVHQRIDELPDELLRQVADFTAFLKLQYQGKPSPVSEEWSEETWDSFALQQFYADADDEPEYTLRDAREVYRT